MEAASYLEGSPSKASRCAAIICATASSAGMPPTPVQSPGVTRRRTPCLRASLSAARMAWYAFLVPRTYWGSHIVGAAISDTPSCCVGTVTASPMFR